ncbi:MAG: mechanosensitive ion channel [Planctomycetota bacterium]|nr:mechanosensitive ion channel [Planctomycetota bacterium]
MPYAHSPETAAAPASYASPASVAGEVPAVQDTAADFGSQYIVNESHTSSLAGYVDSARDFVLDYGPSVVASAVQGLVIVYIGQWVARLVYQFLLDALRRGGLDETLTKFAARLAQAAVLVFTANAALPKFGVETDSVVAAIAAAGLAVGLALQGSLSNFAAGVMLVLFRHFGVGDFIEAAGTKGIVEEIHMFHTVMRTPDNVRIIVPNGSITAGNISNYSAEPIRRIDLVVNCGYGDDLLAVKQFLQETVLNDPRVRNEPAPIVAVDELAEKGVNFVVRPWVASEEYWETRRDMIETIKLGFDAHGFRPQPVVNIISDADDVGPDTIPISQPTPVITSGLITPRRVA